MKTAILNNKKASVREFGIKGVVPVFLIWGLSGAVFTAQGAADQQELKEALQGVSSALGQEPVWDDAVEGGDSEEAIWEAMQTIAGALGESEETAGSDISEREVREALDDVVLVLGPDMISEDVAWNEEDWEEAVWEVLQGVTLSLAQNDAPERAALEGRASDPEIEEALRRVSAVLSEDRESAAAPVSEEPDAVAMEEDDDDEPDGGGVANQGDSREDIQEALRRVAAALNREQITESEAEELREAIDSEETRDPTSQDAMGEALQRVAAVVGERRLAERRKAEGTREDDSYRLSVRDRVQFSVRGENDLNTEQRLDGNGRIRVPMLGNLTIRDMTIREAEAYIEGHYIAEEIFRDPEVTLRISDYAPKHAYVLGQVNSPGEIAFPVEENALDIVRFISMAGGFTPVARSDRVSITRTTEDGEEETMRVDVRELFDTRGRGRDSSDPIMIYPGDVVFVPERLL